MLIEITCKEEFCSSQTSCSSAYTHVNPEADLLYQGDKIKIKSLNKLVRILIWTTRMVDKENKIVHLPVSSK